MPFDLSYWEALRAYWRYYWPPQLVVFFSVPLVKLFPALALVLAVPVLLIALFGGWLFVSRLYSRPYRGFSLVIVETPEEVDVPRLNLGRVTKVWSFLWWRQIVAGACGLILTFFVRFVLSIGRVDFPQQIVPIAAVLVMGPILLKMLIGHPLGDFRLEARRAAKT